MKSSPYRARVQIFVCANLRPPADPLGKGCGDGGEMVFSRLKSLPLPGVWITKTHCLGLCPKTGCTVTIAPAMQTFVEVEAADVDAIVSAAR